MTFCCVSLLYTVIFFHSISSLLFIFAVGLFLSIKLHESFSLLCELKGKYSEVKLLFYEEVIPASVVIVVGTNVISFLVLA